MRRHAKAVFVAAVVCSFFAIGAAPALAAYGEVGVFAGNGPLPGGGGTGNGEISNPGQVAVNDSTGDIYVADTGNDRVQVFTPTEAAAEYDSQAAISDPTGIAIDQTTGDVYVATPSGISKFDASLSPIASGWTDPAVTGALAVDPSSGDLLVADTAANLIRRFEADGTAAGSFASARPIGVAANSSGEVFAVTTTGDLYGYPCGATSTVVRYSAAGVEVGTIGASLEKPGAVAVDSDDDSIYVVANTGQYVCENRFVPLELAYFAADGSTAQATQVLRDNTLYGMAPGATSQGEGSGRIYVVTRSPFNDQYGATQVLVLDELAYPEVTIDPVDTVTSTTADLSGTVNPEGKATEYAFEYSSDAGVTWRSTPAVDAGSGATPVPVAVTLEGLNPNAPYRARLKATNLYGPETTAPITFQTAVSPPIVETLTAAQVSPTEALLRASVNAAGEPTAYYFEYGLDTSYGSAIPIGKNGSAGSKSVASQVVRTLTGLQPGTVYHYRVVAENGTGKATGQDQSFMTATDGGGCANGAIRERQGMQYLPDCRAFELVSPAEKDGNDVITPDTGSYNNGDFAPTAAAGGDAVAFSSHGPFAEAKSHPVYSIYKAVRGSDGWSTKNLVPYLNGSRYSSPAMGFEHFTDDLESWFVLGAKQPQLAPGATEGVSNSFLWDGQYRLLSPGIDPEETGYVSFAGWSDDLSKVVMTSNTNGLTDDAPPGVDFLLYEWSAATGELALVGKEPGTDQPFPSDVWIANNNAGNGAPAWEWNPVSSDGSKIYFYAPGMPNQQLYVRIDGTTTQHVSASQASSPDPNGVQAGLFHFASKNGEVAFFSSGEKLTDDATTGPLSAGNDLYRYEVDGEQLVDITVDVDDANGADVQGVMGGSDDGSRIYFVARGELAPGAVAGEENLYLWTDDGSAKGEIEFVSTGVTSVNWNTLEYLDQRRMGRVTGDGMHALFQSTDRLTSYENNGKYETYLYDAGSGEVTCVSCNPSGAPATTGAMALGSGDEPGIARTLSEDGRYVFFNTTEALVPTDVNNRMDAYQYDAQRERIDLISTGTSEYPAEFVDASAYGGDVFITTRQKLLSADFDDSIDVYDARTNGGFLSQSPPPAPVPCFGEACRTEPVIPPNASNPGSSAISGKGNVKERKKSGKKQKNKKQGKNKKKKQKKKNKSKQKKSNGKSQGARR